MKYDSIQKIFRAVMSGVKVPVIAISGVLRTAMNSYLEDGTFKEVNYMLVKGRDTNWEGQKPQSNVSATQKKQVAGLRAEDRKRRGID